ncbi:hypothetical protein LG943_11875 [Streptomonospora sp. S1-112]|uniref:Uncharacterized protein n=1 Tax=Streptomonospora mangrovi TaxID=2883123 RepID=A0A9X3NKK8_9ACTN|nr:hypothetical protein [Streptomonospora mangrovi]MDA0565013.1 hypothetical protein [Streptomonospora mangrovi]
MAVGSALLLLRILNRAAERRWPALRSPGPPPGPSPRPPDPPPGDLRNEVHGDIWGTAVQAGRIDHLHLHLPPPADRPAAPGPAGGADPG